MLMDIKHNAYVFRKPDDVEQFEKLVGRKIYDKKMLKEFVAKKCGKSYRFYDEEIGGEPVYNWVYGDIEYFANRGCVIVRWCLCQRTE